MPECSPHPPAAVLVIDADGQHPVEAIPQFLAASATADLVVGNRILRAGRMPLERRIANRISSVALSLAAGRWVPDSQCGMRLLTRRALHEVEFAPGGFEAETLHLKRCLAAGVPIAWVSIPAIYAGAPSAFRAIADSAHDPVGSCSTPVAGLDPQGVDALAGSSECWPARARPCCSPVTSSTWSRTRATTSATSTWPSMS